MTWRATMLLTVALVVFTCAVFLRPASADQGCDLVGKAFSGIASQRDAGVTINEIIVRAKATKEANGATDAQYAQLLEWIVYIYTTDKTPAELYELSRKECMRQSGKVDL